MNPWMLQEVRKDDVAARYREAEQSRLAALASDDSPRAAPGRSRPPRMATIRQAASTRTARWVAGLVVGGTLLVATLTALA